MGLFTKKPAEPLEEKAFANSEFFGVTSPSLSQSVYSSCLTSALQWIQTNIREADVATQTEIKGLWEYDNTLPLIITNNPDGINLTFKDKIAAVATDLILHGNGLFLKLKNSKKQNVSLQYIPWCNVKIKLTSDNTKIESYTISNVPYAIKDVVHIRKGVDPNNPFNGLGVLSALQIHNSADYYASVYTSAIISSPAPSAIIFSKSGKVPQESLDRMANMIKERSSVTSAGSISVLNGDFSIEKMSLSPEELNIQSLIDYTESRICALTGVPAIVLGLSSGTNTTYANYAEAQKTVTNNLLVPIWKLIADAITEQLPDIFYDSRLTFKYEEIQALQSDLSNESDRVGKLYSAGVLSRAQALEILGLEAQPGDETIYKV